MALPDNRDGAPDGYVQPYDGDEDGPFVYPLRNWAYHPVGLVFPAVKVLTAVERLNRRFLYALGVMVWLLFGAWRLDALWLLGGAVFVYWKWVLLPCFGVVRGFWLARAKLQAGPSDS